jgi:hypothetical protein
MVSSASFGAFSGSRRRSGKDDLATLLGHIDRLTDTAAQMLDAEKDLG